MSPGLIVGIVGTTLTAKERAVLTHASVVGVILFARNYASREQLVDLTTQIRNLRCPRLLICVDQEGGRVQRFVDGFTPLPPLGVIGRWYRTHPDRARDLAYRHGRVMAAEVLAHGVDLSLAPVLDLDRGSSVIGDRAFSDDPDAVADVAGWYLAGMRDAGMKCCGKHFPGHGSVEADSHDTVVTDSRDRDALKIDTQPFQQLSDQLDAVMPAHVVYPAVDSVAAGFSTVWMDYLRGLVNFEGVIVSDDLDMAGAGDAGDVEARWRACQNAGVELALVCQPASAEWLVARLPDTTSEFADARDAAARLQGRAAFTLDEQLRVPEFRAWRASLAKLAGEAK